MDQNSGSGVEEGITPERSDHLGLRRHRVGAVLAIVSGFIYVCSLTDLPEVDGLAVHGMVSSGLRRRSAFLYNQ